MFQAIVTVLGFTAWVAVSWLGPSFTPTHGWTWQWSIGAVTGYSLLSVFTWMSLVRHTLRHMRSGHFQRNITNHLAPFWSVAILALLASTVAFRYMPSDALLIRLWLSAALGLILLTSSFAVACAARWARLSADQKQLDYLPDAQLRAPSIPLGSLLPSKTPSSK